MLLSDATIQLSSTPHTHSPSDVGISRPAHNVHGEAHAEAAARRPHRVRQPPQLRRQIQHVVAVSRHDEDEDEDEDEDDPWLAPARHGLVVPNHPLLPDRTRRQLSQPPAPQPPAAGGPDSD